MKGRCFSPAQSFYHVFDDEYWILWQSVSVHAYLARVEHTGAAGDYDKGDRKATAGSLQPLEFGPVDMQSKDSIHALIPDRLPCHAEESVVARGCDAQRAQRTCGNLLLQLQ